jgi:hypothetical protein
VQKKKGESLFLSVDTSFFRSNEVVFSFLPRNEAEARTFVSQIVAYFIHKFDADNLRQIFQPEAIQRAKQSIWDADKNEIISPSDLYLDQSGDIIDDFDILEVMGTNCVDTTNQTSTTEIDRVERLFTGDDSTSVGTLFTNNQSNPTKQTSTVSMKSSCTTMTMEDVERNMNALTSDMAYIKTMMQHLVNNKTMDVQVPQQTIHAPLQHIELTIGNNMDIETAGGQQLGPTCHET